MALPFHSMLRRTHRALLSCSCVQSRLFASKEKNKGPQTRSESLQVISLFEKSKARGSTPDSSQPPTSYRAVLDERHDQASRSVLVRVHQSPQSVCDSLQTVGPVKAAYILQKAKNYLLVEFQHKKSVEKLLRHVTYFPDKSQIPVRSRLLYHMQTLRVQQHRPPAKSVQAQLVTNPDLTAQDYRSAESVSRQMEELHSVRKLSDVGSRLRFFIASMVGDLISNCLPCCHIDPFGSSSNGFGWEGCDLDMMMSLKPQQQGGDAGGRFRFLTKRGSGEERVFAQQSLDVVGEMVRVLMPSAYQVHKVLNARVPIIKFHHEATVIDCDLSYFNLSGTKTSELMHLLGEVDSRVRVLMSTIKQWAKSSDLTRPHPGQWPANFSLLAMLVVFLQSRSPPVLPSLRSLQALARAEDHFTVDDVDYAFVTDVNAISKSANMQPLDELLHEFFHFYAHLDFASCGLSLIEGSTFSREGGGASAMLIENPLELCHNVSNNVSAAHVNKMQVAMLTALRCLDQHSKAAGDRDWGLLCLFQPPSSPAVSQSSYSVANLFSVDQDDDDNDTAVKTRSERESGDDSGCLVDGNIESEEKVESQHRKEADSENVDSKSETKVDSTVLSQVAGDSAGKEAVLKQLKVDS